MAQHLQLNDMKFSTGDTVRVHQRIKEGEKTRIQIYEGVVIAIQNRQSGKTFTVRKIATGAIGVERIFPVYSPMIEKVEVKQAGMVRRAKLFYLRNRIGKAATSIRKRLMSVSN
jgi:large subunit ribosomal protein L19